MALVEWGELAAPALGRQRARGHARRPRPRGGARAARASPWSAGAAGPSDPTRRRRCSTRGRGSGRRERRRRRTAPTPAPRHGGDRDGDRDGRGRRPDGGRRAGRADVDGPAPPRRDAHAGLGAPAGTSSISCPADLGVVAVDIGPGLFTGLRVGVAAAKGLAQSLGLGVMGATSLDILTAGAAAAGLRGLVLACVDARRGEVFAAVHEVDVAGPLPPCSGSPRCRPVRARRPGDRAGRRSPASRCTPWETARCATPTCCGRSPGVDPAAPGLAFPPPAALLDLARARLDAGEPPVEPGCGRSSLHA